MHRILFFLGVLSVTSLDLTNLAHADGKVDEVKKIVKSACQQDLDDDKALRLVKSIFLSCVPGQTVDLEGGCQVKCQKNASGAVVGG